MSVEMVSYGLYEEWHNHYKDLPKLKKFTYTIPCETASEFGYILNIKKGKGKQINYTIKHPDFLDSRGTPAKDFAGTEYINSNDWSFFLGDTIWEPIEDKAGKWQIIAEIDGKIVADKTFEVILPQ